MVACWGFGLYHWYATKFWEFAWVNSYFLHCRTARLPPAPRNTWQPFTARRWNRRCPRLFPQKSSSTGDTCVKSTPSLDNFNTALPSRSGDSGLWKLLPTCDLLWCCDWEKKSLSLHLMRDISLRGSLEDTEGRRNWFPWGTGRDARTRRCKFSHFGSISYCCCFSKSDCERLVDDLEYDYILYWHYIMYLPKADGSLIDWKS